VNEEQSMVQRSQRGQVAPLIAVALVFAGFFCLVVARFGVAAASRAHARTTADAAALAGAVDGRGSADNIARANAGTILTYEASGRDVKLRVRVDDAEATAKARRESGGNPPGAAPALRAVLARAAQLLHTEVPVTAVRDDGLAADVRSDFVDRLRAVAPQAGLCQPEPSSRPTLFEVCPAPSEGSDSLR
jgi:hypothetical protein